MKPTLLLLLLIMAGCSVHRHNYTPVSNTPGEVFYHSRDVFNDLTVYRHKEFLPVAFKQRSPLEVYLVKSPSGTRAHVRFYYIGTDWLFMQQATLINGTGNKIVHRFDDYGVKRDVIRAGSTVYVQEVYEAALADNDARDLLRLLSTGTPAIQLAGDRRAEFYVTDHYCSANITMLNEYINYHAGSLQPSDI